MSDSGRVNEAVAELLETAVDEDLRLPYRARLVAELEQFGWVVDLETGDIFRDPDAGGGKEEAQG